MRAFKNIRGFSGGDSRAWVLTIVRNKGANVCLAPQSGLRFRFSLGPLSAKSGHCYSGYSPKRSEELIAKLQRD
jgi:hypothetical protein